MKNYNHLAVIWLLKARQGDRSQGELAADIGVSRPFVHDVLNGKRPPGPQILRYLGLEVCYCPIIRREQ